MSTTATFSAPNIRDTFGEQPSFHTLSLATEAGFSLRYAHDSASSHLRDFDMIYIGIIDFSATRATNLDFRE